MEIEIIRNRIKELIIKQQNLFEGKRMLNQYERGTLDTLVEIFDEEFMWDTKESIYERIHNELGIDLMAQRQAKIDNIRKKVNDKIDTLISIQNWENHEEYVGIVELREFYESMRNRMNSAIDEIDITKNRPELWNDMQDLKTKLNSMIQIVLDKELWNDMQDLKTKLNSMIHDSNSA